MTIKQINRYHELVKELSQIEMSNGYRKGIYHCVTHADLFNNLGEIHVGEGIEKLAKHWGASIKTKPCGDMKQKYFVHDGIIYFQLFEEVKS
jgi:hypothetical protein